MLRLATATIALASLGVGGIAVATAPPDTEPADTAPADTEPDGTVAPDTTAPEADPETTEPTGAAPDDTGAPATTEPGAAECPIEDAEPATVYDDEGDPAAVITLTAFEVPWNGFEEGSDPDEGREYARATLSVENVSTADSAFEVNVDHFILQDELGFVSTGGNVRTMEQAAADEDAPGEAHLDPGESTELAATFEAFRGLAPDSLFYRPNDERLTDVAELC